MAEPGLTLDDLLDARRIRRLAGSTSFERGEDYAQDGRVRNIRSADAATRATVSGTRDYRVKLWVDDGELAYACSCPVGTEGDFCKHCVATALVWTARHRDGDIAMMPSEQLHRHLRELPADELAAILLEEAENNEALYQRLMLRAARTQPQIDPRVWRQAIDDAVNTGDFVRYGETSDFASGIADVIKALHGLVADGHAAAVIDLAEHGIEAVEDAIERVDDSDGEVTGVLRRFEELHLAACSQARPDPKELARRLYEWETTSDWDVFSGAAADYADVLGEIGMAEYRRLALEDWSRVPAIGPDEDDAEKWESSFRISAVMETLERLSGDLDALIAVKSRDLSAPNRFLDIARLYAEAMRNEESLAWAERGWNAFPETRRDPRLREFLADAYHDRGRGAEAVALMWQGFQAAPALGTYKSLKDHGERAGSWPVYREQALQLVRTRIAATPSQRTASLPYWASSPPFSDHSVLVEIFLMEDDAESAWDEARSGGCSRRLWLELADRRRGSNPLDAIRIYRDEVALRVEQTSSRGYQEALAFLRRIAGLLDGLGQWEEFQQYVAALRGEYRRKRNFIKMIDEEGWQRRG